MAGVAYAHFDGMPAFAVVDGYEAVDVPSCRYFRSAVRTAVERDTCLRLADIYDRRRVPDDDALRLGHNTPPSP